MATNGRTVAPRDDGQWANVRDGGDRATSLHPTQEQATRAARQQLESEGGGELKVLGEDGRIRQKDTIPPGNDPREIRG